MEYYKTYCQTHPYEAITNFCSDTQCLLGLCATCICEHTQQHLKKGTPPSYENIKNTYTRYNQKMKEQVGLIEQDKEWLTSVCHQIEEKKKKVQQTLIKAREECIAAVNRHFDELEQNIESEVSSEGKKNSLHSSYRLETLNTLLMKEVNNLLMYSKDLSSPKFLETIQQVEQEVFPNSSEFHLRVSKELRENEVFTATTIFRDDLLPDLSFTLKKMVNLEFQIPRVQLEDLRRDDYRRGNSAKKGTNSLIVSPSANQFYDFSKVRNVSAVLSPAKSSIPILMPTPPIQQILNNSTFKSQNEVGKVSRLSSGLKIIRESKRENVVNEDRSMSSSCVSHDKQNELALSTYCDSASNFYR